MTMTQTNAIIFHLMHAPLSSLVAFNKLGTTCLPRRIWDIQELGFTIDRKNVVSKNRWGNRNDYYLYSMPKTRANQRLFKRLFGKENKPCK